MSDVGCSVGEASELKEEASPLEEAPMQALRVPSPELHLGDAPVQQPPLHTPTKALLGPVISRKRSAFTIENIMGHGDPSSNADNDSPGIKKSRNDIFDSIPSPPPKIEEMHNPAVVGVPHLSGQLYNPFLLNLAARNSAAMHPANVRPPLGLVPTMHPFMHPGLIGYSGGQSVW